MHGRNSSAELITPSWYLILIYNQLDGRKSSSWLSHITGLSHSRFRQGASFHLRDSSLEKIQAHIMGLIQKEQLGFPINELPSLTLGLNCPFQDFAQIHNFPLLQLHASNIDEFDRLLVNIAKNPTLEQLKNVAKAELLQDKIYWTSDDQVDLSIALQNCTSLEVAIGILNKLSFNVFLSFMATFDIEFCSLAFRSRLKLRPLFLDLVPKAHFEIPENTENVKLAKYKDFSLPTRRLLELTYAIVYYAKYYIWPKNPVKRQELERFDGTIGNFFDGSKKLTAKRYETFTKQLLNDSKNKTQLHVFPLVFATLFWEKLFVKKSTKYKLEHVILYDESYYRELWELYHQKWASQLHSGEGDWPMWLNN